MTITNLISTADLARLGAALCHFLWQGAILGVFAAALSMTLRRSRPHIRYAVFLALLLASPGCLLTTYVWLLPKAAPVAFPESVAETTAVPPAQLDSPAPQMPALPPIGLVPPEQLEPWNAAPSPSRFNTAFSLLAVVWGAGVALLSLRLVGGYWQVRRYAGRNAMPLEPTWLELAERLAETMQVRRKIVWLQSTITQTPLTFGWLRPIVVTPTALLSGLTVAEVECLLAHELAHIRRHDFLINLLQSAIETLLFYHPAIWWISRQIRFEREQICDEIAIQVVGDRVTYGKALLSVATAAPVDRLALAAGDSDLKRRIQRIFGSSPSNSPWKAKAVGALAACTLLLLGVALSSLSQTAPDASADEPTAVETFVDKAPLRLQPIEGRVLDDNGTPLANVKVVLRNGASHHSESAIPETNEDIASTQTDDKGRYRFVDIPFSPNRNGRQQLLAWLALDIVAFDGERAIAWKHLQGDEPHLNADLKLSPPQSVSGRVVNEHGSPIAGARVSAMYCMSIRHITQADLEFGRWPQGFDRDYVNLLDSRIAPETLTDDEGRFELKGMPANCGVGLRIRHSDHLSSTAFAATVDKLPAVVAQAMKRTVQTGEVAVSLSQGRRLILEVVAEDSGEPIPHASLDSFSLYGGPPLQTADEQGKLVRIIPKDWSKVPYAISPPPESNYLPTFGVAEFEEGTQEKKLVVKLSKGAIVTGTAIDETNEKPIGGIQLRLVGALGDPTVNAMIRHSLVKTDDQGNFRAVIPPGKATVTLGTVLPNMEYEFSSGDPTTVEASLESPVSDATIRLKRSPHVNGTVYSPNGQPLPDVAISYRIPFGTSPGSSARGYLMQEFICDEEGKFSLPGFPFGWSQGEWAQKIPVEFRDRKNNARRTVSLDKSALDQPLKVFLRSTSVVVGRLIDSDFNQPIRRTTADLYYLVPPADGNGPSVREHVTLQTDQQGRFRLELDDEGECESVRTPTGDYPEHWLGEKGKRPKLSFDQVLDLGDVKLTSSADDSEEKVAKFKPLDFDPSDGQAAFDLLARQYESDYAAFERQYLATESQARKRLIREVCDPTAEYVFAMLKISDAHKGSEVEFQSLHWIASRAKNRLQTSQYSRQYFAVIQRLIDDYPHRAELADCVSTLTGGLDIYRDSAWARIARADRLIEKNESREARGTACYCIGMSLVQGDYRDPRNNAELREKGEKYLRRVIDEFSDIPLYKNMTLGQSAERMLYELYHLQPTMPAPEIDGIDPTGKPLKLSDFRGKIVLLNFWGSWCGPCIFKLPGLQKLAEEFPDQLVILGVMSDTPEAAQKAIDEHQVKFRNLVDGPHAEGKIIRQWNVNSWPTSYLIDDAGKIVAEMRSEESIRAAIHRLLTQPSPR